MMTLLCTHKPKFASVEAYLRAFADFLEFICPPSDQPKSLGRGYFF